MPPDESSARNDHAAVADKGVLRIVTSGSVDDGKSTLIGRLMWDTDSVAEDQKAELIADSGVGQAINYALLLDGLSAEREQGITIDVAYRFFETARRKFVIADVPGHEQYIRNMVTGASNADLAIILVDAQLGIREQTRRHLVISRLMGIGHVVVAINKMDVVGYDAARFDALGEAVSTFAHDLGIDHIVCIPLSAQCGDNVVERSARMDWYGGPTLFAHIETVDVAPPADGAFRMPVQWVNRPNAQFRGFAGTIAGGHIAVGDEIKILPSYQATRLARIVTGDGDLPDAAYGDAVTLVFAEEIDVSRGAVVVAAADDTMMVQNQFQAQLVWLGDEEVVPGRTYEIQLGKAQAGASIMDVKQHVDLATGKLVDAKHLTKNEVGKVTIWMDAALAFDPYSINRKTGAFVLLDRYSNTVAAAGTIDHPLRRATNVVWHDLEIDRRLRALQKAQKPVCIWFTGLSGAGKSTIANTLDKRLSSMNKHTYILDGDNVRHGLNKDLGFTEADRVENIRRIAEVAKLMIDAGLIVIVCAISPYREDRAMARELIGGDDFIEVFVDTPLDVCESNDVKGLYKKARSGQIPNFTGISAPYEAPLKPELRLNPVGLSVAETVAQIEPLLLARGI